MGIHSKKLLLPAVVGMVQAILTLNLERLSVLSENGFWGGVQRCEVALLFPGMLGAMLLRGNVHVWSLWVAALLNGAISFGIVWVLSHIVGKFVGRGV